VAFLVAKAPKQRSPDFILIWGMVTGRKNGWNYVKSQSTLLAPALFNSWYIISEMLVIISILIWPLLT